MSSAHSILHRALNERFKKVSNSTSLAQGFVETLYTLARAINLAFEKGDRKVAGSWHYILDIDEACRGTPLRPDGSNAMVVIMNLSDTCTSKRRRQLAPLTNQGMALIFNSDGAVTALTTKKILRNQDGEKIDMRNAETFRIQNPNKLEEFVASWLRGNLNEKTMIEIQNQLELQDQAFVDTFSTWTPEQCDRLFKAPKP